MSQKANVLFVCTGNSCRSQMAEGWAHYLYPDRINAFSAGIEPRRIDPLAVKVMKEAGVDISRQDSHSVDNFLARDLDLVVTVCSGAKEACPRFPAIAKMVHQPFDDPPQLARNSGTEDEALVHYRRVRDEIRDFVRRLPDTLGVARAAN
jgi:arsenate reductase (thioredoxin)